MDNVIDIVLKSICLVWLVLTSLVIWSQAYRANEDKTFGVQLVASVLILVFHVAAIFMAVRWVDSW